MVMQRREKANAKVEKGGKVSQHDFSLDGTEVVRGRAEIQFSLSVAQMTSDIEPSTSFCFQ